MESPGLERILNRLLRCSHRHQTSPMTLKGETFATCLDCGGRVPYSLDSLRAGMPCKKVVGKVPVPKQPGTRINSSRMNSTLRKWTREGVWLGLLAAGFAGGIFYSGRQRAGPENRVTTHAARAPQPELTAIPAALPDASGPMPAPVGEAHRPTPTPRLESDGRTVVLAHEAAAALEVAQHPGKLPELVQSGSLFSVSRGTPVRIVEKQRTVVDVVITGGPLAGQQGWVAASRVAW
jgi:hypothetical protein